MLVVRGARRRVIHPGRSGGGRGRRGWSSSCGFPTPRSPSPRTRNRMNPTARRRAALLGGGSRGFLVGARAGVVRRARPRILSPGAGARGARRAGRTRRAGRAGRTRTNRTNPRSRTSPRSRWSPKNPNPTSRARRTRTRRAGPASPTGGGMRGRAPGQHPPVPEDTGPPRPASPPRRDRTARPRRPRSAGPVPVFVVMPPGRDRGGRGHVGGRRGAGGGSREAGGLGGGGPGDPQRSRHARRGGRQHHAVHGPPAEREWNPAPPPWPRRCASCRGRSGGRRPRR